MLLSIIQTTWQFFSCSHRSPLWLQFFLDAKLHHKLTITPVNYVIFCIEHMQRKKKNVSVMFIITCQKSLIWLLDQDLLYCIHWSYGHLHMETDGRETYTMISGSSNHCWFFTPLIHRFSLWKASKNIVSSYKYNLARIKKNKKLKIRHRWN